jgi:glycosyltransferase involved in cell wall biosynthesis
MATHNGEKHVARQLETILSELNPGDEVIVVDDQSTDRTVEVVDALGDARIRCIKNPQNMREMYSFGRAMSLATKQVVFLADQDDIWVPGRVNRMVGALSDSGASLVTTNFVWMNDKEDPIDVPFDGVRAAASRSYLRNIVDIFVGRTNYFGCAMAMTQEFSRLILPIPPFVQSHDLWIALAANASGSNVHLDDVTLRKRQHGNNATSTVSRWALYQKLWSRAIFVQSLLVIALRRLGR